MCPIGEFTATALARSRKLRRPGLHADGNCLYLKVTDAGTRSWVFRWRDRVTGKLRYMGLGPLPPIELSEARKQAEIAWKQVILGLDPIEERNKARAEKRQQRAIPTFDECAKDYIDAHAGGWSNAKHVAQWRSSLETYASPIIGKLRVSEITAEDVLQAIKPIWSTKNETATRVRGRIESVLDWAGSPSRQYRSGDNPARWRGNLDKELPKPSKVKPVKHHKALPYARLRDFMEDLNKRQGTSAACLQFTILTATRTAESIGACWEEFDFDREIWTVPACRMKAGREFRVPLSAAARALIEAQGGQDDQYVFPGVKPNSHLSNMAMLELLKDMSLNATVHGFRSTFRDWSAETTQYPNEVCEMALAHSIGDKTEEAYRRGDLFEKRRALMQDWATYAGVNCLCTETDKERQEHPRCPIHVLEAQRKLGNAKHKS